MSQPVERSLSIRRARAADNVALAHIIRVVMPEFGAVGAGFSIEDREVDAMSEAYRDPRAAYFVAEVQTAEDPAPILIGGAGIAELIGAEADICELRKMYLLREGRGFGAGSQLLTTCLAFAAAAGFRRCYLETLTGMNAAQQLYERAGFAPIPARLGDTGHFACNRYYLRSLVD